MTRATFHLGSHADTVETTLREIERERVVQRIWDEDHTVWSPEPDEIGNRLGWLRAHETMRVHLPRLAAFADEARRAGFTDALLLGMGGSSLAPEVFAQVFGTQESFLTLHVLDSTDPAAVQALADQLDPRTTLHLVSTKSGGTVETLSLFKFFFNRTRDALGAERAGSRFVAITDPGSKLAELAGEHGFRETFENDPNYGGRYAALSLVGLVPAALLGLDLGALLDRAAAQAEALQRNDSDGVRLGAALGALGRAGRDKLTLLASPGVAPFGAWLEQLVAESTGKDGTGILPVDREPPGAPEVYGDDRLFVLFKLGGETGFDNALSQLAAAGHPVVEIPIRNAYDLGSEFLRWEFATALAGWRLGIHPFDQPNVESAKDRARDFVSAYLESGTLPEPEPALVADGVRAYADVPGEDLKGLLHTFLDQARSGDYLALQAYVPPSDETDAALRGLRLRLRDRLKLATTLGYGPRFLHSTGQLHKGDRGNGLFLQITCDDPDDLPIPDEAGRKASGLTFGTLKAAQALGDFEALRGADRRVLRLHFASATEGVRALAEVASEL